MAKRILRQHGSDLVTYHAHEDGVNYFGHYQEMDGVIDRVKELNQQVNQEGRNRLRNNHDWRYGGSVPWAVLLEWLKISGNTLNAFACEKDIRTEFITWMRQNDMTQFIADDGHLRQSRR
jgi:hypothetical protein